MDNGDTRLLRWTCCLVEWSVQPWPAPSLSPAGRAVADSLSVRTQLSLLVHLRTSPAKAQSSRRAHEQTVKTTPQHISALSRQVIRGSLASSSPARFGRSRGFRRPGSRHPV